MIYVYAEFEVDPTTTVVVVVLNVIPNGFNLFTTFVKSAACVFAEKKGYEILKAMNLWNIGHWPIPIILLYYILLGHKQSLGGILPFCWVRWPCGWWLLPVTWLSWSLKDLTRIVILLPCQFFSHFVLTVHLHRLQNSSWNSIGGPKNLSPLRVLRARVLFNLLPGLKAFLLFPHSWEFFSPWFDSLSTQLAKSIWKLYLLPNWVPNKD